MGRKKNVKPKKKEEEMEIDDEEQQKAGDCIADEDGDEVDDEESEGDSEEEGELMDDNIEKMEKVNFDFEAFPLESGDVPGLVNLLTQIFLRSDVDCEGLAGSLVEMSPLGCVYKPAEECLDEDDENVIYGVLSMTEVAGPQKFQTDIANLILNRARKFANKDVLQKFESVFNSSKEKKRNYILVNERMLHFPDAIAAPAFSSFKADLEQGKFDSKIDHILVLSKVRIPDSSVSTGQSSEGKSPGKKKAGKAEKKRRAAEALANAEIEFENSEESLLFNNGGLVNPVYFQYGVEGDVEKDSKFHTVYINGVAHRPFRRVSILTKEDFFTIKSHSIASFLFARNVTSNPQARCYDSRIASFLNSGLVHYSHDMGSLSKYVLDQIVRARYSGSWFIHAEMIQNQRQGLEWQSVTNGDLFAPTSPHGCYYHDTQTYVIILKY
ncbi:hypothetical protein FO519_004687 [Halicephalobus sp. NKZ332]|nr:hypothetical protein FO519_004687 [Halicephalobus sp. NKZ332]